MTTAVAERELTVTREGVELVSIGTWDASTGKARITANDLKAMVEAYENPAHDAMPVKIGHDDDRFQDANGNPPSTRDGEPAYGWIENLRVSADGKTLIGDLIGVPKMLADVMDTALRRRSVELTRHERVGGKVYPAVLNAVSLLGVQAPAVKGLADLRALFSEQLAQQPEHFSVEIGGDTPVIPQSEQTNHEPESQQPVEGADNVKLNAMQKKALGLKEDATDAEVAAFLKKFLSEGGEENAENARTVEQTAPAAAATTAPVTQTPAAANAPQAQPAATTTPLAPQAPAATASTDSTSTATTQVQEELTPQAVAAAAGSLGLQVIDTVMLGQLQRDALAGRQARDEQDKARRDAIVQQAVRQGKIAPGAFQAFRKQADSDESGLVTLLAAMPEILPTVQIGHGEQFTGADPGSDRSATDTAAAQKRASVYAHFGIPAPVDAK